MKECTLKVIVVGEQGVGKTSLLARYNHSQFKSDYSVTIGVQFTSKKFTLPDQIITLQIWDTAGQQAFRSIIKNFYRGAQGVLLTYSLTKSQTLQALQQWVCDIEQATSPHLFKVLVGTKADLSMQRAISEAQIQDFYNKIKADYRIETSSKTGQGVEQLFQEIANKMSARLKSDQRFNQLVANNNQMRLNLMRQSYISSQLGSAPTVKPESKCCR